MPSDSASHLAPNYAQRLDVAKHDEIMSKNRFTGTATQPRRNRKLCQFNKDQYCTCTFVHVYILPSLNPYLADKISFTNFVCLIFWVR